MSDILIDEEKDRIVQTIDLLGGFFHEHNIEPYIAAVAMTALLKQLESEGIHVTCQVMPNPGMH